MFKRILVLIVRLQDVMDKSSMSRDEAMLASLEG